MPRTSRLIAAALLLSSAGAALAQDNAAPARQMRAPMAMAGPVVSLSVTETVDAAPDLATINTGVETRAQSAKEVMAQNAAQVDRLINALLKAGIARKDIQTGSINLSPQYDYSNRQNGEPPRFIGYQANNMLTVTIRKIEQAGTMVDAMVNAGATNINGPSFGIDDTSALEAQARDKAIKTAMQRAADYAKAAGYSSARLLEISENGMMPPPAPMPMRMAKADAIEVTGSRIEPGQLSTSITLNFRYRLER